MNILIFHIINIFYFILQLIILYRFNKNSDFIMILFSLLIIVIAIPLIIYQDKHRKNIYRYLKEKECLNEKHQRKLKEIFNWGERTRFTQINIKEYMKMKLKEVLNENIILELEKWQQKRTLLILFIILQCSMLLIFMIFNNIRNY